MLTLTAWEEELFDLLLKVAEFYKKKTVLRVAGGWVRDKLLHKESHDLDIALDDISGVEFAGLVNEYLHDKGIQTRTVAVIQVERNHNIYGL
jgi:tRNA nucleotidyltransferase/poly(A) polymerase